MFGSKLRSWMENHIVRPRKKGNKNKNATSNLVSANATQNGHKGTTITIYQGDTTIATTNVPTSNGGISSPARRSEVSPIQSHKTSRIGWQTPQDDIPILHTPEHYYFNPSVKSNTLSATSLHVTASAYTATNQLTLHSSSTTNKTTKSCKTLSPTNMPRKSSYPQSSAENACNHHNNHQNHQQSIPSCHQPFNHKPINPSIVPPGKQPSQCNSQYDINFQNNNSKSQSCNYKGILSPQQKRYHATTTNGEIHQCNGEILPMGKDEVRYGKILPSKHAVSSGFSTAGNGTYDRINANIQFQPITNLDDRTKQNNNNNAKHISNQQQQLHQHQQTIQNQHLNHHQHHHNQVQQPKGNGPSQCRTGSGAANQNLLRTNRYNGASNGMLGAANNHPMGHVMNSLSSPESAYSTGYSTDGTSPGASYTPPEYYINMRTGTHYFPKGVNTLAIEATRYKFGLNKIEEMSPQDPLPNNHRRTESFDLTHNQLSSFGIPDPSFFAAKVLQCQATASLMPNNIAIQSYKGFESPSPRQRCRIRTNPWYSTTETSSSGGGGCGGGINGCGSGGTNGGRGLGPTCNYLPKKIEIDASSSSSGIKSSSETGASDKNEKNEKSTESESSSSTEVEVVKRNFSPSTIRRRKAAAAANEQSKSENHGVSGGGGGGLHSLGAGHPDSDEDATLNEMMGKFDESYVYEKETDILSDSDPTDCPSDLDTGQDAGDECDTDELLDIDFIDTGSIQEIVEKEAYKNTGSCSYFSYHLERRASKMRRSRKTHEEPTSSRRRKRLLKTRKKPAEVNKDKQSPVRRSRESRSVGGTPVSLRRNQSVDSKKPSKISPLTQRSNSLTLTEVHAIRGRFVAIAESEKALLKADLEADVKYKQLIHEAETILVSMKTTALRETPVASPRRVCNPPANKRVEMLRNCEADLKRESVKHQKLNDLSEQPSDGMLVNKRIEVLRSDPTSAPNSPKSARFSPRKTHITNFIHQNIEPVETSRRCNSQDTPSIPKSPQLQLNGRSLRSPPGSPSQARRRVRSQSPRTNIIYSDSDSEEESSRKSLLQKRNTKIRTEAEMNGNRKNDFSNEEAIRKMRDLKDDLNNRNIVLKMEKMSCYDESDRTNRNIVEVKKPPLMAFRSVDMGNRSSISAYCPQSEPLKRKVYKGSSTFERIKKSLDMESEIPKQAILEKITNLRRERQALKSSSQDIHHAGTTNIFSYDLKPSELHILAVPSTKHQLILNTIEDLKRSLEDQSVELSGLNGDDDDDGPAMKLN